MTLATAPSSKRRMIPYDRGRAARAVPVPAARGGRFLDPVRHARVHPRAAGAVLRPGLGLRRHSFSFGQALFFGVAGYCCALLATKAGITSILLLLPVAALAGLVVSLDARLPRHSRQARADQRIHRARHADRLLRGGAPRARLVLCRRPERHSVAAAADRGQPRNRGRAGLLLRGAGASSRWSISACAG